jgi:hypothetical protein
MEDTNTSPEMGNEVKAEQEVTRSDRDLVAEAKEQMFGDGKRTEPKADETSHGHSDKAEQTETKVEVAEENKAPENLEQNQPEDKKTEAEPKPKPSKEQQRIGQLTRVNANLKQRLTELEKAVKAFEERKAPKSEDYTSTHEFDKAQMMHEIRQGMEAERIEAQKREIAEATAREWTDKVREQVSDYDSFAREYTQLLPTFQQSEQELLQIASESAVGPKLLEAVIEKVYKNPTAKQLWDGMSSRAKVAELVKVELALIEHTYSQPTQPAQSPSVQPAPSAAPRSVAPDKVTTNTPVTKTDRELVEKAKREMFM